MGGLPMGWPELRRISTCSWAIIMCYLEGEMDIEEVTGLLRMVGVILRNQSLPAASEEVVVRHSDSRLAQQDPSIQLEASLRQTSSCGLADFGLYRDELRLGSDRMEDALERSDQKSALELVARELESQVQRICDELGKHTYRVFCWTCSS